jgi:hypothetical protein
VIIDLISIYVIAWIITNAVTDTAHAIKGTTNPRYEIKRQKALAAGKAAPKQPRYGSRDWAADLVSDGLAAQTERRRAKAAKKAEATKKDERPLDDLAESVREEPRRPVAPATVRTDEFPNFVAGEDYCDTHQMPRLKQGVQGSRGVKYCPCGPKVTFIPPDGDDDPGQLDPDSLDPKYKDGPYPLPTRPTTEPKDTRPDAVIYQFPNPKKIEKEIRMATSEVTGLSTALAFAQTAADAHASFATGGTEGYTGALAQHGVGDGCIGSAREAQEASSIAAAKWAKHHEDLTAQLNVKEAYQGSPDAGDKRFLLNG